MKPEDFLIPLVEAYDVPDTLVAFLFEQLEQEIKNDYYSLTPHKDDPRDPAERIAQGLKYIFDRLPPCSDASPAKLTAIIQQLVPDVEYLYRLQTPREEIWYKWNVDRLKHSIKFNEDFIDRIRGSDYDLSDYRRELREYKEELKNLKPPVPLVLPPIFFSNILSFPVSFDLPKRNQHCHILGTPGTGKTSLIKQLVYQDMQTEAGVILMVPKGDAVSTLAKVPCDRTIWIKDWSEVGLNLLDLDASLLSWVFGSALESDPSPRQTAFLRYCASKVKNLSELKALLDEKPPKEFDEVPLAIKWRFGLLPKVAEEIFSRPQNLDFRAFMDEGRVVLIDTSSLGKLGSRFIGRFIVALIANAINERRNRKPVYVYLDEAPDYITEHVEEILDKAREANVCLHLAHQTLKQLSERLKASVHNTKIKFVSNCNAADAAEMGREMRIDPAILQTLPDMTFMLKAFEKPFPIHVTHNAIEKFATAQRDHFISPHPRLLIAAEPPPEDNETFRSKDW